MKYLLPLVLALAACEPKNQDVQCGAGTHLEDLTCVVDTAGDAGTDTGSAGDTGDGSFTVCADGVAPYSSIQAAIDAAFTGDTLMICAGEYPSVSWSDKALNLVGEARDLVIIHGDDHSAAIEATDVSALTVSALTLGGTGPGGGAAGLHLVGTTATVSDVQLTGCEDGAESTHGILVEEGSVNLEDLLVADNLCGKDAGIVRIDGGGPHTLRHSVFRGNGSADDERGGFVLNVGQADAEVSNNVFYNNAARGGVPVSQFHNTDGGAIIVYNNVWYGAQTQGSNNYPIIVSGVSFQNNIVADTESCITVYGGGADYNLYNCSSAQWGVSGDGGENSLTDEPLFNDAENGDFTLNGFSPAVDGGNPSAAYNDPDLSRNDMGAFGGPSGAWTP